MYIKRINANNMRFNVITGKCLTVNGNEIGILFVHVKLTKRRNCYGPPPQLKHR